MSLIFKCPICKNNHIVQRGVPDFICKNSLRLSKVTPNKIKDNLVTENNFVSKTHNLDEDVYEDYTIVEIKPKAEVLIDGTKNI